MVLDVQIAGEYMAPRSFMVMAIQDNAEVCDGLREMFASRTVECDRQHSLF